MRHSLYTCGQKFEYGSQQTIQDNKQQDEINRLKANLKRVTEEKDILKKAAVYFAKKGQVQRHSYLATSVCLVGA